MTDYFYYKITYKGTYFENKSEFERFEKLAEKYVKSQINEDVEYEPQELFDSICAVAEALFENHGTINKKSESVDGYSVTYSEDFSKNLFNILKLYLPKKLLYRGILV